MSTLPDFMFAGTGVPMLAPAEETGPRDEAFAGEFIAANDDAPLPPPPPFVSGVFDDMPASVYHSIEAMSSGGGKKIRQSPAHYRLMRTTRNVPTAAMQFGTAVHAGVLEPDTFDRVVVVAPELNLRKPGDRAIAREFAKANAGRVILSVDELARARRCIDAVRKHPSASKLLAGAIVERSLFWMDARYQVPCKARLDLWNFGILGDVKTCLDASPEGFARSIASYEYHAQAAHYASGCEHVLDQSPQAVVFIAVESIPPHCVACYALPGNAILAGARLANLALGSYAEALALGEYRGYPDTIETIQLPKWALRVSE